MAKKKRTLPPFAAMTVGTLLVSLGVYFFKFPNNFSFGGVTGLAVVVAPYLPISASDFTFIANVLLLLLGCVREWLSAGTVFGHVLSRPVLPMASMPAGGFIVLGVLCAVWRTLAKKHKNYLTSEARGLMAVYRQKEGEPEDE